MAECLDILMVVWKVVQLVSTMVAKMDIEQVDWSVVEKVVMWAALKDGL